MRRVRRRRQTDRSDATPGLAGWLLADLFLGLVVVFLALAPGSSGTDAASEPPPATSAPRLDPNPVTFEVANAGGRSSDDLGAEVRGAVERARLERGVNGALVGFAIILGSGPDPGSGIRLATATEEKLRQALPDLFGYAASRDYWGGNGPTGSVKLELFLLV